MLLNLTLAVALLAGAPAPEKSALESRAEAAMRDFDQLRTEAERRSRQELLLALSDSLEAAGHDVHASQCLERAGIFSYQFGEYPRAQEIFDRGLAVARRSGDGRRIAALLNACAIGVSAMGDDARALELQQELILQRREIQDRRGEGVSWYNLAYSYVALYRIPEAIEAFRRALQLNLEVGNHYGVALTRSALAPELFWIGQIEEGLALADSAVTDARRQEAPVLVAAALGNRARMRTALGRFAPALDDFRQAGELARSNGLSRVAAAQAVGEARVLCALGRGEEAMELLDAVAGDVDHEETEAVRVAWAAARGRALAATGRAPEARLQLRQALDDFARLRAHLDPQAGRAESIRVAGWAWADLAALEDGASAWRVTEEGSASVLREQWGVEPVTLERFQSTLGAMGAVAVQFGAATPEYVVACVVSAEGVRVEVLDLPADLALDVANAMHLVGSGSAGDLARPALGRIARVLLAPLDVAGDRIVVIPGAFAGLPLEALPVGGREFGTGRAVSYAPSATAFVLLQEREVRPGPVLVVADPALPPTEGAPEFAELTGLRRPLVPLPEAREEARHLASDATILEGELASRSEFLDGCSDPAVIHVAAHAVVDASHPDHSALVLAGGDPLDAGTIGQLHMQADLVSLSGCSTADGYLVAGEGTFGLTRAFLVAGARSVVASWWDVDDAAARRFMELFYSGLRAGEPRDRALQSARERMGEEGFPARDRLAFALVGATGDPVAAVRDRSRPFVWAVAGGLLLIVWWLGRMRRR